MPPRVTGKALPIDSVKNGISRDIQLQGPVFRKQIPVKKVQHYLFISANHRNYLSRILRRKNQRYRQTAVIECCHLHSWPQLPAVNNLRLGIYHKIYNSIFGTK